MLILHWLLSAVCSKAPSRSVSLLCLGTDNQADCDVHSPLVRFLTTADEAELANTLAIRYIKDTQRSYEDFVARVLQSTSYHRVAADHAETLRWAASIVSSRAFVVSKPKDPEHPFHGKPFLAPGADLLDHSPMAQVGWRLGRASGSEHATHSHSKIGEAFSIHSHTPFYYPGAPVMNHYQVRTLMRPQLSAFALLARLRV